MSHWSLGLSRAELERDQQAREDHRGLLSHEMFWRDHQVWLAEQGYMLRPRYRPGWQPSWEEGNSNAWMRHEDGPAAPVCHSPQHHRLQLTDPSTALSSTQLVYPMERPLSSRDSLIQKTLMRRRLLYFYHQNQPNPIRTTTLPCCMRS